MRPHGTAARYSHGPDENGLPKGCRCHECREAVRLERRRQRERGPQMVSSVPAKRAVRKLRSYGWTLATIASELGLSAPQNLLKYDRCTRAVSDGILGLLVAEEESRSRRLPLRPILDELAGRGCASHIDQAEWLGIHARQLYRWLEIGVPLFTADRFAVMLQRHPVLFWPDFFEPEPLPSPSAA